MEIVQKVAIVGSTELTTKQTDDAYEIVEALIYSIRDDALMGRCDKPTGDIEIVSGGAVGIDHIAQWAAEYMNIQTKIFLPDIQKWESEDIPNRGSLRGFKARNLEIAQYCDRLICIRSQSSKTYGSGWTADRAEELGKHVLRIFI